MIYLASPYSSPDPLIQKTRFLLTQQCVAGMLRAREFVYSPIVHCHEVATQYSLPTDFEFWKAYNFDMLRRADRFAILNIKGWYESVGVAAERQLALTLGFVVEMFNEDGAPCV